MIEIQLASADGTADCVYRQWFLEVFLGPFSNINDRIMPMSDAVSSEGPKTTGIQQRSSALSLTHRCADGTGDGGDMTPPRFIVTRSVPLTVSRKATSVNRGSIRVSSSCGPDRRSFKRARSDFWKTLLTQCLTKSLNTLAANQQ